MLLILDYRPNQVGQSDMSAQDGAALWISTIEPLRAKGCKLVSPATTSAPSGKQWIKDMLTACNGGCTVSFIYSFWLRLVLTGFHSSTTLGSTGMTCLLVLSRPMWCVHKLTDWI